MRTIQWIKMLEIERLRKQCCCNKEICLCRQTIWSQTTWIESQFLCVKALWGNSPWFYFLTSKNRSNTNINFFTSSPITSCKYMGKQWKQWQTLLWGLQITANGDHSHEIKGCLLLGRKVITNPDRILKKQRHYFANKGLSSQSYGFSSSHVWMWELDYKES